MATVIAKTLQEKFGFMDPDILKPEHDEMVNWVDDNIEDLLMLVFQCAGRPKNVRTKWEGIVSKTEDGNGYLGFVDLVAIIGEQLFLFEAKTTIDSLGALFRQIRLYQEGYVYSEPVYGRPIIVVCPDDKYAQRIRDQGLYFLKYDPKMKFVMGGV